MAGNSSRPARNNGTTWWWAVATPRRPRRSRKRHAAERTPAAPPAAPSPSPRTRTPPAADGRDTTMATNRRKFSEYRKEGKPEPFVLVDDEGEDIVLMPPDTEKLMDLAEIPATQPRRILSQLC